MFFTVFTPTFNREYCLHRVYNSLQQQTVQNFEWIVIDDGSTDGTRELVAKWSGVSSFPIIYRYQINSGKHIAWNRALDLAHGEYFICADSDDVFEGSLISEFQFYLQKYENKVLGIGCLCKDQWSNKVGVEYKKDELISTIRDIYFIDKSVGEKWFCVKTNELRKRKFPEIIGLTHYPESYLWMNIDESLLYKRC